MSKTSLRLIVIGFMKKGMQINPICMIDADYYYILDGIELRENIDFKGKMSVNSDE